MAVQRKYPEELREHAVKMVFEVRERTGRGMASWCEQGSPESGK
jgi:hypothetical protein